MWGLKTMIKGQVLFSINFVDVDVAGQRSILSGQGDLSYCSCEPGSRR